MFTEFIPNMIGQLAQFVLSLDFWQQIGALTLVGAIPFVESYFGSMLGSIAGLSPFIAVPAAVAGNIAITFLLIALAGRGREAVLNRRAANGSKQLTGRQQKVSNYFNRFGVPGVALLGPMVLASQFTAPTLVALGANRRTVYLWVGISIIVWGVAFGFFGSALAGMMN